MQNGRRANLSNDETIAAKYSALFALSMSKCNMPVYHMSFEFFFFFSPVCDLAVLALIVVVAVLNKIQWETKCLEFVRGNLHAQRSCCLLKLQ